MGVYFHPPSPMGSSPEHRLPPLPPPAAESGATRAPALRPSGGVRRRCPATECVWRRGEIVACQEQWGRGNYAVCILMHNRVFPHVFAFPHFPFHYWLILDFFDHIVFLPLNSLGEEKTVAQKFQLMKKLTFFCFGKYLCHHAKMYAIFFSGGIFSPLHSGEMGPGREC